MEIYLLNIFLILLFGFFLIRVNFNKKKKKYFCLLIAFHWILISGLRAPTIGADTVGYIRAFKKVEVTSWKIIFNAIKQVYFNGRTPITSSENFLYKDTGYLLFQKVVHIFTDNPQVYLFIVALIIFISLAFFVYNNSSDPIFSYILFSTLFYSFYAITGIRQALATALIVFIGSEYIKKREIWKFAMISLFAYILHKSAIVFIPFYFLAQIKITKKYLISLWLSSFIALNLGASFILKIANKIGYEREDVFKADTTRYTLVILIIGIVASIFSQKIPKINTEKKLEFNATLLATIITLFTLIDQSIMRIQQYYALFLMFSIPSILNFFDNRSKKILQILCIIILILYLIKNNPQYMFFWEEY